MNKPVCKIVGFDEFGPLLEWSAHWSTFPIGTALAAYAAAQSAGVRTGWPAEGRLMQDDSRALSRALASDPNARQLAREAAAQSARCDCGKKLASECDKWEPGCDLGQSAEHARPGRFDASKIAAAISAAQSAPSEPAQGELPPLVPTPTENTLIGQAQRLIGALMSHKLIPSTLPEDQYLKLWDVVKRQLRCVNKEGARAAIEHRPEQPAQGERESFEALRYFANRLERCLGDFPDDETLTLQSSFLRDCAKNIRAALAHRPERPAQGELPPLPAGWKFNHARQQTDDDGPVDGVWEIGWLEVEDNYFAPIVTVDTGLYYQDKDAEPLAQAILARLTESRAALASQPAAGVALADEQAEQWLEANCGPRIRWTIEDVWYAITPAQLASVANGITAPAAQEKQT